MCITAPRLVEAAPRLAANVADYLLDNKSASATALMTLQSEYTYGDLRAASDAVARYLTTVAGVRKGDRALLVSDNSFFWAAAYLGIMRAGMVCIPLPPATSAEDLSYIISATEPVAAFAQTKTALKNPALASLLLVVDADAPAVAGLARATTLAALRDNRHDGAVPLPVSRPSDLAALMFTSGSTGKPRGVMVSHANIIANTDSIIEYLQLTSADRIMAVLPFHYCFGTSLLHTHLRVGGSIVIDHRFMFPEKVLQRMRETECTGFAGVPSHFQILLRNSSLKKTGFPHLRYVQQAGGNLAPALVRELRAALPTAKVFVMYGQTEATARLSYLPPEMFDKKPGSIGKGIPGVRLEVLNEAGQPVRANGESGEIVASGANVTAGYWRSEEETAVSFRGGKLYTGDLATVDEDGFIYIVGRGKDFIKCGGKRISCRVIEDMLLDCEELLEAAVIGIPDDVLGEAVKAFVVPGGNNGSDFRARMQAFCQQKLPLQLIPKEIVILPSLPKNSSGKVCKNTLRQL